jgi:putative antitoxin of VapBC-like toxin-antitoxin system
MAVKTITIDLAAYEALAKRKRPGDSFSDVIKAHFSSGGTGRDLLSAGRALRLESGTLDRLARTVTDRKRHRARAIEL